MVAHAPIGWQRLHLGARSSGIRNLRRSVQMNIWLGDLCPALLWKVWEAYSLQMSQADAEQLCMFRWNIIRLLVRWAPLLRNFLEKSRVNSYGMTCGTSNRSW